MPIADIRPSGGALLPDMRKSDAEFARDPYSIIPGYGTGFDHGYVDRTSLVGAWVARQNTWHQSFEQVISTNIQRYWHLYRNFDSGPSPGPGQEWRDRTVVPQAFKEIMTRVPRIVLGQFGVPEPFTVVGRGFKDETYEEQVRVLIQQALDGIGVSDPQGELFLKRIVDGETYCQIMGHVWWKVFWRKESHKIQTKIPLLDDEEKIKGWEPAEFLETLYDNVDILWLPISDLAIDVYGRRRWSIERIRTSLESLQGENERFKEEHGHDLYPQLDNLNLVTLGGPQIRDRTDEPRDTEHWPLDDGGLYSHDPGETPVELWLCWDNVKRTLTKIANRRVVLDHGLAPTPDGLDPYIGVPAVPVPRRPYGDSMLNWTGPLNTRQTRLSRARMDETMLNMFQQYLYREGELRATTWFWRPGGGAAIEQANKDRPISDSIFLVPRRQLPPEAYAEESYTQRQSEATAGADSVSQGVEATTKSRDVTAAEINQRVLQGASRYQLEILYKEACFKKPLLQKIFDLLRQNLTTPRIISILDDQEGEPIDLTKIRRPIDIVVGGSMMESTLQERLEEMRMLLEMGKGDNAYSQYLKPREILVALLKATKTLRRNSARFVKTKEEVQSELQEAQIQMGMAAAGAAGAAPSAAPAGAEGAVPPGAQGPGPGAAGLDSPAGASRSAIASSTRGSGIEIV